MLTGVEQVFSLLNMSSIDSNTDSPSLNDRTARAKIRDAAISSFAQHGVARTTARKVAAVANVSPGLVIHHFGSMEGLRSECDEYVASVVREQKKKTIQAGGSFDIVSAIRNSELTFVSEYLARALTDDSPAVNKLVDDLVSDAEEYMVLGVESGTLKPSKDPRTRAAIFSIWSLGALVLHAHMSRLIGIDLTDLDSSTDESKAAYFGAVYEFLSDGLMNKSVADQLQAKVSKLAGNNGQSEGSGA